MRNPSTKPKKFSFRLGVSLALAIFLGAVLILYTVHGLFKISFETLSAENLPRWALVEGNSMLPTLRGGTVYETCLECGFHGPRASLGTSVCTNCGWMTLEKVRETEKYRTESEMEIIQDKLTLTAPQEKYALDDIVVLTPNAKVGTVIKRIVGLPGDTLEIREGALFRNGKRFVRPLKLWREMRIPVYLDDFRPRKVSRWERLSPEENETVAPMENGWRFDAEKPAGIMYAHKTGRFFMNETGGIECKMVPGPITNFRAENGTQHRADMLFPIMELQCTFNVKFSKNTAFCAVSLPTREGEYLFLMTPELPKDATETLRHAVTQGEIRPLKERGILGGGAYSLPIFEEGKTLEVTVSTLDGLPRVSCNGMEIQAAEILDLKPFCNEKDLKSETESGDSPKFESFSTARVWCWGGLVEIYHLSLFRGEYWGNFFTNFRDFSQNTKKTFAINCNSCYYVVGDNFLASRDSRQWGAISPEKIHGKVIRRPNFFTPDAL